MGLDEYFQWNDIEEVLDWQLKQVGSSLEEMEHVGVKAFPRKTPLYFKTNTPVKFNTPSGRIELYSQHLADTGHDPLPKYVPPERPPDGYFHLNYGRAAAHTFGRTINNPLLFVSGHLQLLHAGLDPTTDLLPIAPAAHYLCGGIVTDLDGGTSLPGLWAAGETTCTGVHGANRLASNSLLEGLVLGECAGRDAGLTSNGNGRPGPVPIVSDIRALAEQLLVVIEREGSGPRCTPVLDGFLTTDRRGHGVSTSRRT